MTVDPSPRIVIGVSNHSSCPGFSTFSTWRSAAPTSQAIVPSDISNLWPDCLFPNTIYCTSIVKLGLVPSLAI